MRVLNKNLVLMLCLLLGTSFGCSRKSNSLSLKLSFGKTSGSGNSSQALAGQLEFAVVNVQIPGAPFVKQFDFKNSAIPAGQVFTLEVPDVPMGTFLVQFLGVYKNTTDGVRNIGYGDVNVTVGAGTTIADLTAAQVASATKEGRVVGRYIDAVGPPMAGPTGTMVMRYAPPGGKPKMNIEKSSILDGWFQVMVLEGVAMDYVMIPSGKSIFNQIALVGPSLMLDKSAATTGQRLMQVTRPRYFHKNNTTVEMQPPSEIFIGFFFDPALGFSTSAPPLTVCYPSDIAETIPGAYQDVNLTQPLEIVSTTGPATQVIVGSNGGMSSPQSAVYTETSSPCVSGLPEEKIYVNHATLVDSNDSIAGFSPPFKAVNPFARWDKFIAAKYNGSDTPSISVNWRLIPALHAEAFTGTVVFGKFSVSSGSSSDSGDRTCDKLAALGYVELGEVAAPGSSLTLTSVSGNAVNSGNFQNFSFALCGFRSVAGQREYVGSYVTGSGGGGEFDRHTGWSLADLTPTGSVTYSTYGGTQHLTNVNASGASPLYTSLSLAGALANTNPGDEVMLSVVGSSGTGPCSNPSAGQPISTGTYGFARVIDSSGNFKITKGSFVDRLDTTNLAATPAVGGTYCNVKVAKVLQYRNLDLSSVSNFDAGSSGFSYNATAGILPIRVGGTLTLSGSTNIHANAAGFQGGGSIASNGAGDLGPANSATGAPGATGSGGRCLVSTANGGGGAGLGGGAQSSTSNLGGVGYMSGGMSLFYGGGGGGGAGGTTGGNGGGIVFVSANKVVTGTTGGGNTITANGGNGGGSSNYGGGGGGGSVVFYAKDISGAQNLNVAADGGSIATGGGVGGGGYVDALACAKSAGTVTLTASAAKGAGAANGGASPGQSSAVVEPVSTDPQFWSCRSSD